MANPNKQIENKIKKEFRTRMTEKRLREDYIINNWIPGKLKCSVETVHQVLTGVSNLLPNPAPT